MNGINTKLTVGVAILLVGILVLVKYNEKAARNAELTQERFIAEQDFKKHVAEIKEASEAKNIFGVFRGCRDLEVSWDANQTSLSEDDGKRVADLKNLAVYANEMGENRWQKVTGECDDILTGRLMNDWMEGTAAYLVARKNTLKNLYRENASFFDNLPGQQEDDPRHQEAVNFVDERKAIVNSIMILAEQLPSIGAEGAFLAQRGALKQQDEAISKALVDFQKTGEDRLWPETEMSGTRDFGGGNSH